MKKLSLAISLFSIAALSVAVLAPAVDAGRIGCGDRCDGGNHNKPKWEMNGTTVDVEQNADVSNHVMVSSNTGFNLIGAADDDASIMTGNAVSGVLLTNFVNTADTSVMLSGCDDCDEMGKVDVDVETNARVHNDVKSMANTGFNLIDCADDNASIKTGNATSVAEIGNVVNTTVTSVSRHGGDFDPIE